MQNTYQWRVIPSTEPTVTRSCPKCSCHSEYESTGNFRVNANSNHIDVWLIYQCSKCKSTWNMEILSRVNPNTIGNGLYSGFLRNDPELARQYAFDKEVHSRNKSILNNENIDYQVSGFELTQTEMQAGFRLELHCEYPLDLRLDKLLCRQLGLTREQMKKLSGSGKITGDGIKDILKARLRNGMLLNINC